MLLFLLNVVVTGTLTAEPRCSYFARFLRPSPDITVVLAEATGDTVRVPVPDEPLYRSLPDTLTVTAYRFVVLRTAGGSDGLREGRTFLAIPWSYDAMCRPLPWLRDDWVPRGATAVFTVGEMRRVGGDPAFDVRGGFEPYPQGALIANSYPRPPADRAEWLSATDYFTLQTMFPHDHSTANTREQLADIERAIHDLNPAWSEMFPATTILRRVRERVSRHSPGA